MKNILISNIEKIKTTPLGAKRIRKNLGIECNEVEFCKKQILKKECFIEKIGKNI